MEAHGGTIRLSSRPGEGPEFVIELPLDAGSASAEALTGGRAVPAIARRDARARTLARDPRRPPPGGYFTYWAAPARPRRKRRAHTTTTASGTNTMTRNAAQFMASASADA